MNLPMNLAKLKQATVVAAIFTITASFAPEAAQARSTGGPSVREFTIEFDLNTSVIDSDSSDDVGFFSGAIENFTLCFNPNDGCSDKRDYLSGNITTSIIQTDNLTEKLVSESINLGSDVIRDVIVGDLIASAPEYEGTALQYQINLDNQNNLFLYLPSTGDLLLDKSNFINSLSGIDKPITTRGVFYGIDNSKSPTEDLYGIGGNDNPITLEPTSSAAVPEPSTIAGLFAIGALGAVFIVKRKQSSKRIV